MTLVLMEVQCKEWITQMILMTFLPKEVLLSESQTSLNQQSKLKNHLHKDKRYPLSEKNNLMKILKTVWKLLSKIDNKQYTNDYFISSYRYKK
jgi:hypothetical protein